MISKEYWKDFYKGHRFDEPSGFAQWVLPRIKGTLVDLGCGDGRDTHYFRAAGIRCYGVDASNEDVLIIKQDVSAFIKENESPDNVYTRFFWHAIPDDVQEEILDWTTGYLFIEARTTKDRPKNIYGKHDRNLVDVKKLEKQLKKKGFDIEYIHEGYGMSKFFDEDPHLVRIVAKRVVL